MFHGHTVMLSYVIYKRQTQESRCLRKGRGKANFKSGNMIHFLTCVWAAGSVWAFCLTTSAIASPRQNADEVHEAVLLEAGHRFPSAATCKECHPKHYREWSVSPHAYSQMSPVFNAMHATITN